MNHWKKLLKWSGEEYHDLPWRKKRSLYRTLVSEIMLQQTTVGTVINHFDRFIKQYPNIESLSKTTEEEICIAWKGLGYYRRARNLRKAAIDIQNLYKGRIPQDREKLLKINGVGEYTASALLAIGGNKPELAVDANLERVLARVFGIEVQKGIKLQKHIRALFLEKKILKNIDSLGARDINEALMDLGRVYCQARKAHCTLCPMSSSCHAFKTKEPLKFPLGGNIKKIAKTFELKLLRVVVKKKGNVIAYKKSDKEWLSGQLEIPTFILETDDSELKQYPFIDRKKIKWDLESLTSFKTGITKYKIQNFILEINEKEFKKLTLSKRYNFHPYDLKGENFSTASLKTFKKIK